MKTIVSPRLSRNQSNELLNALEAAGLVSAFAQKLIESKNNYLAEKVVQLIRNGIFEPSTSQIRARKIMKQNFFGVEDAIAHFGVNPSKQQISALAEIPWSEEVLQSTKNTHILVAVFQLSILDIRSKVPHSLFFKHEDAGYNKEKFAKDLGEIGWQLIRKIPVEHSFAETWNKQQSLLSIDEETPKAQVMVYAIIGHFLSTGERLFKSASVYVRCVDLDSHGYRVCVGCFELDGLNFHGFWAYDRHADLGLSGARKRSIFNT